YEPGKAPKYLDRSNPPKELKDIKESDLIAKSEKVDGKDQTTFADGRKVTDLGNGQKRTDYPPNDAQGRISRIDDNNNGS
ncbi:hypothetical protein ACJEM7_25430, partial [Escherichia coli]